MDSLIADVIGDVALVLVVSQLLGAIARRCGQPSVVGQIVAGIMLGPAFLGRLPGHLTSHIFPSTVLPSLTALAQVAVVIFMFVVGYELDRRPLQGRHRAVVLVAVLALFTPMGAGSGVAFLFRSQFGALDHSHFGEPSVLFMGVALSITALPVLAAIVRERGIARTVAGVTSTAAAGLMDVTGWLVLAAVLISAVHKPGRPWLVTFLLFVGFVAVMLLVVRPALNWWLGRRSSVLASLLPVALMLAMGSAWFTAFLGLQTVFGAFLAGLTMPRVDGSADAEVIATLDRVGGLLLPLFFVVTGLSLKISALGAFAFAMLALLCVIACVGKLGPAYLGSRLGGLSRSDSAGVAALVNTRGLTELIALNVGLSAGLIGRPLFSVLVLMALLMTMATAPLLSLIRRRTAAAAAVREGAREEPSAKREDAAVGAFDPADWDAAWRSRREQ